MPAVITTLAALLLAFAPVAEDPGPSAAARQIVAETDRIVVARVTSIVEYEPGPDARTRGDLQRIRVGRLAVEDVWFGDPHEPLFVRLSPSFVPSDATMVFGLEPARGIWIEEWRRVGAKRPEPGPTELWQFRTRPGFPWALSGEGSKLEVDIPSTFRVGAHAAPTVGTKRRVDAEGARADLLRAIDASSSVVVKHVSNGPGGPGEIRVDDVGAGRIASGATFRWTESDRARWRSALELAGFAQMPPAISASPGPCLSWTEVTAVTRTGRRTVRHHGGGTTDGSGEALDRVRRYGELMRTFESLLPQRR